MCKPFGIRVSGPLEPFVAGFLDALARQGYSPWSATSYLVVMRHLSRWLGDHGWALAELTPGRLQGFVEDQRDRGYAKGRSLSGMVGVLAAHLRALGGMPQVPLPVPETFIDRVLQEFATYLINERGLTHRTMHWYRNVAGLFVSSCWGANEDVAGCDLAALTAGRVSAFILAESRHRSVTSIQHIAGALRALMRFLYLQGHTPMSLTAAVPTAPGWRDTGISRALDEQQVSRLLASCNRQTPAGLRDFAILTVLARLGLRSHEVASLTLDDVDWRNGEILVVGKGNRYDRLPLPVDVGEALSEYCRKARPRGHCRALFLQVRAPYAVLSSASSIGKVVERACRRSGLPLVGAHRLRHTTATAMRRAGAPLSEIGQILRHRWAVTTARYAKDDRDALATIARPWPGGAA